MASFEFESFSRSGLTIEGPWFTLHYGHSTDQAPCVVLHAHEMFRNHSSLSNGVDGIAEFLEQPKNPRVAPLTHRTNGAFLYPCEGKTLDEWLRQHGPDPISAPATLVLMRELVTILDQTSLAGEEAGVYNHGCLYPTNILISVIRIHLIGYGLPPVYLCLSRAKPR